MKKHKLGVCVPYRNREAHLHEFIPKVGKYLKNRDIDFQMYFCHQVDDKLFNRGATKNIAAQHAFNDGCDYIVWHDIDMIPEEGGGADYSYPTEGPRHIATQISQMGYQLKYHEYFGGAVLFTKEDVEKTNGYSNNYWDWGMEDDDLFWRCKLEGLTNDTYLDKEPIKQKFLSFDGDSSYVKIPIDRKYKNTVSNSHTISVLCRAYQQPQKNPIFLIGDVDKQYVEYPIFRIPGFDYGISFNNSRALSFTFWNTFNDHNYMWVKRYDGYWSWVTAVIDTETNQSHFYLNGSEIDSRAGYGSPSPYKFKGKLKSYSKQNFYLGYTPSLSDDVPNKYFKGDIAKVFMWDRNLSQKEIANLHNLIPNENLIIDLDFNNPKTSFETYNTEEIYDEFKIPNSILPYRVDGRFRCLPHEDEGIVNGKFVKGETTAKNEKRYVLNMQRGNINYKTDGIAQTVYDFISEERLTPWAKMINIELI
jgi:hypothetical protein